MKKFAKILGFLGFFVTLATAQIGTAWADGQYCGYGYDGYYGLGRTLDDCNKCAEDFSSYPNSTGGYNFSGDLCYSACSGTCIDANSSFQAGGTYGIPATSTFFVYKLNNGTQNSLLNINGLTCGNIGNYCAEVFDCGKNACSANWKTINFVDHNNNPLGTLYIVYGMIWSTQQTTACNNCAQDSRNYAVFYPVFQTPTAPTREGYTFLGYSDSQTGGIIRIGPDHNNMYGKLNYNNATNISGISGNTITLYARYENAGCAQNYWYNSQTDECIPCAEGFTSPGGYGNQHTCTKSCSKTCTQRHNSTDECAEGVTGFYSPIVPIYGTEYEDDQGHCYDNNNIEILAPDNDLTEAHWCQWNCDGCKDEQCYTFVGGACEPKVWNAMYDCDEGTNVITDTNHPESYGNYIIADFSCQGQNGQTFIGWTLGSGGIVYNHNDPEHDELTWGCGHQTFKPVFEDNCYEVSFDDETNGGHPSGYPNFTPGTHTSFYKKYNNTAWYSDSKCSDKIEIGSGANQVNVIGHLPWKAHATFTGYYYETPTPNRQIFNASGNLTTGNNSGSDWTITGNTVLYAQYTCVEGYAPNANGDCVGDKIDVKYTCVSPVDGEPDTHTFNDDATYGAAYLVKSVGTGNHNVPCAFTGYELDNDYVWNLQDYSGNSTNPNGEYGPNETLSSADWQYITTTPLTEIEFILDKSLWHLKTYTVEYRCGNIKPGADVYTDSSATYGQTYNVAGQFDPFNGGNVTVQDFLDNNCKPNGGFGAWTFQNWTFTCAGANSGPYNTNDPTFGTWTYDSNNCYFTANWAQTDFVIILDQNGGTDGNPSDYLYTRKNIGVYLDSARTLKMLPDHESNANPLTPPQKTINITIYPDSTHDGTGASFTYNGTIYGYNGANNYANIDENLDFMGYYQNITLNPEKYIDPYDGKGYITSDGIAAGKTYDENNTNDQRTWVAHWGTGTITLPSTATWAGHDFAGWTCVDDENTVVYSCGTNQSCQVTVSENITCTAQWSVACRSVSFDDTTNGEQNSPTNGGNNGRFSKVSGVTGWYDGTECGGTQITPSVIGRIPTKTNGHFIGYNTAVDGTGNEIFNESGNVTTYGSQTWAPVDDATLYAQYECDEPYHLDTDSESATYGQCVACDPGFFYDPTELNPAKQCKDCNEYIHDHGASGSSAYTWTSKDPYNWSINQCYRVCDNKTCEEFSLSTDDQNNRLEQFLEGTQMGKQISFYGNEFATNGAFNTCSDSTDVRYCPVGLLGDASNLSYKPIAAPVDFHIDPINSPNETKSVYIVGGRVPSMAQGLILQNGFAWSQVSGPGQNSPDVNHIVNGQNVTFNYIHIIYPATAPRVSLPENYTFTGYGYPQNDPVVMTREYNLLTNDAASIVSYANSNAYNDMSPIVSSDTSRNLYAQYTANPTYTLTYSCGDGGGTPSISPNPVENIHAGYRIVPAQPEGCANYGNLQFRWWAVSNSADTHLAGDAGAFEWAYTENKTFTAIWGAANTYNITYLKMPATNNSITPAGNTLEMPSNISMPNSYTCNASPDTSINGVPRLKNADGDYIGEVVAWCKDSTLETCDLPLTLSNAAPCEDKNVYAKWECDAEAGYYLNSAGNDCITCEVGYYWDNGTCRQCPNGWTSNPPYNWTINQCYKLCNGSNGTTTKYCSDDLTPNLSQVPYFANKFLDQVGNPYQITFYGNHQNNINVCAMEEVKYCPAVLRALAATGLQTNKTKASKITFMRQGNVAEAGERYIVGFLDANGDYNGNGNFWSHIAGRGQQVTEENDTYTRIIYPTDTAPNPDGTSTIDPAFKGYYDAQNGGEQRVAAALGLDSSNAVAFAQTPLLENQIGDDRTLYPQYCENGQEWDPSANGGNGACITPTQVYDVKYVCNGGVVETDRATYDQTYTVLNHNNLTGCTAPDGKVFVGWGFSNNGTTTYLAVYEDEEEFIWQYTVQQPTFTAIWDDGCYAITFDNTRFGQLNSVSAPSKFYKKGQDWYADTSRRCDGSEINPLISVLPQKDNATFIGYDTDGESADASSNLVFNNIGSLTDYGQTWPTTDDTTLYAKYDCDDGYTLYGTTCVLDSSNFHTITLDKNVGSFYGDDSDPHYLYTIEGVSAAYTDSGHQNDFYELTGFPHKHAIVTFHYCDGTNNSCSNPSTPDEIKEADFTFKGFYATTPATGDLYIAQNGYITGYGNTAAGAATSNETWYADWNGYGTLDASRWPVPAQIPNGYAFGGWYTEPKCEGTLMSSSTQFTTPDTDLYACWSQNVFTVTYDCGIGTGGSDPDSEHPVSTNGTYNVLPNGTANGGVVDCNFTGQGFAGWKFSENTGVNTYNAGNTITWQAGYGDETLTAQYRTCNSNEVLVNGVCYQTCNKECTQPSSCVCEDATCSYDTTPKPGYMIGGGDQQCRDIDTGAVIGDFTCPLTGVDCNNPYLTCNQNSGQCEDTPNVKWNIKFVCDTDNTTVAEYNVSANSTTELIDVPANTVCTKQGYSFTNWKDFDYIILLAAGSNNVTWPYYHNSVFKPDWNDGNVYHVTLAQTDATTNATVQDLYEKYAIGWGYTETGTWNTYITLRDDQLPRRTGYTFGGYKDEYGQQQGAFTNNTWTTPDATTVTRDQTWTPIWTRCSDPYFYYDETSGQCKECESAFHDNPVPGTHEGCYSNCSESCRQNISVCNIPNAATYTLITNVSYSGELHYPGNAGCQLDIWATEPELNGMIPNCECRVQTCETGYHPNNDNTACVPNSWTVNYYCGDSNAHNGPASGMIMWNTATYGRDYKVAYDTQNTNTQIADCNVRDGYILNNWKLNNSVESRYPTGWSFIWLYEFTSTTPTFTAQYVCDTDNGYHQINGTCQQCPENSYWTGSQCKQCDPGYHVNDAGNNCIPNTINLVYSTSCGTSSPSSATCTFDSGFNLATHSASAGYTFNGWTTNGNTYTGPFNPGQQIQCTAAYLGNSVYTNNATITITGTCTSISCPAQLPNGSHASMNYSITNDGRCKYDITCEGCTGCDSSNHSCYTNPQANSDGQFTVYGDSGDNTVLNNVRCEPTKYNVYYRCDSSTAPGTLSGTQATYGEPYYVESNGTTITCQSNDQLFNGWTFNGNNQVYYPGTSNYMINSWNYCNITPIFTASYGQCEAGQIYVPSLGKCRPSCPVPCTWAGYPANPAQCPTPQYPAGATCWYLEGNPAAQTGYVPEYDPNACLNPMTDATITPQTCNVDPTQDPICPEYQHWENNTCEWNTYYVTLDSNNGIEGSNFVSKLFEKYTIGWSRTDNSFTSSLNLDPDELPSPSETCKVFKGYFNRRSDGQQMIQADGYVSSDGYQPLPSTSITDNNRKWYAQYIDNPGTFTIKFRCSANGGDIYTYTVHMGDANLTAPAATVCSGVAFNQWKGSTHPEILLDAGSYFAWNHCFDEVFVPDTKAVYHVDLNENGGMFPSNEYQELWYAVDLGWYKNAGLTTQITSIPGDSLPTKQGSNFNGWLDSTTQAQRGNFSGANWALPASISANETWDAQWGPCVAGQYYQNGQCNECPSGYTSDPLWAQSQTDCYKVCHTCVMPTCPTGEGIDHCEQNPNSTYNGFLFYSSITPNPNTCQQTLDNTMDNPIICDVNIVCETGYVPSDSGLSCVKKGFTIDLKSHRKTNLEGALTGVDVDPDLLYIWSGRGVYWYSDYTTQIKPDGTNPVIIPSTYAVVRFNPNGDGVTFTLDNYTYTNQPGDRNVSFTFSGFYNSEDGSSQYIRNNGVITNSGQNIAMTTDIDLTWHAQWTPQTIGTLPQPTRPGYRFVGWFSEMTNDNGYQISANTPIYQSMNVYARWEKAKYFVNLDKNGGQWGSDPVYKLWESYGTGWSTEEYGIFNPNLTLAESQRPSWPGNSKVFNGYWTAGNNGTQQIRADGSVVDTTATVLTVNNTTWYAQYVDNTNKYTITFRCSENGEPLFGYTQRVQNGDNVRVPSKSACSNEGHTMTNWTGNHNTTFNAQDTEYMATWSGVFTNEDFTPTWNDGNVYHVTLLQNDATQPGVTDLYEKYGMWWSLYQNGNPQITFLSGGDLPSKTGFNFGGYADENDRPVGSYNPANNRWNLPDNTTVSSNGIIWTAIWTPCTGGQYWDGNKCYQCPTGFTDNPSAVDNEDYCYGNCQYDCRDVCPSTNQLPEGMESCTPNTEGYPQPGIIYYGTRLQGCLPGGTYGNQPGLPNCESIITCKPGYHLVGGACVKYVKTDIMLNPNGGTWSSNVPSEYRYLYTIESTGVYRNSARTEEMTPTNGVALYAIPSNGASVTLNANGGIVTWGGGIGEILNRNAAFEFLGFYNSQAPGFAAPYILPQETNGDTYAFITTGGQSAGMGYTTTPNTWYAQWNRSVTLPTPERQNYTFVGWTYNGELVSNSWTVPGNTTNVTLIAQWTKNDGTIVTYNCNNEGGQGGNATDPTPAYIGETYTVLGNFIPCSKPATETTRAHEFENWQFNGGSYLPGYVFSPWSYTGSNPTFNAHYKECGDGYYFGSNGCQACPYGYPHSNIDATLLQHCYKDCSEQCIESCPQLGEPGVIGCIYPTPRPTTEGQEYYGSTCNAVAENCEVIGVYCQNGYVPTSDGLHCQEDEDNYHEITLDPNGGTVGQEKLYTIYNTGVYLDSARTRQMSAYNNYLTNLPQKNAVATFDCNPECSTPVSPVSVELVFNGYYERQSGGAKYINKFVDDGVAKGAITSDGNTAGKSYTANATWFAQWSGAPIGNSRWPTNPTRPDACATYSFVDWYTEANGGTPVSYNTPVSEDVTWYAHWCESCPTGAIANGSCSANNCVATFTCNDGYYWNADDCSCVLSPDTRFTLTYKPNGGTPTQPRTQSLAYGETFPTLGGDTFTKSGEVLCHWDEENHASSNTFPEAVAELSTEYTYLNEENITLLAHWAPCQCTQGAAGVQDCSFSVVNNACVPTVTCMPGYIPNGTPTCAGECNATCDTSNSCRQCPAGTYQEGNECKPCSEGFTSNAGATSCYGNTITIDWDENGGNAIIPDGSCVYGETFTLANAPSHSNSAMQFLGWKLANGDIKLAGASVMCNFTNVGVYSGISTAIQAQWNECQCINPWNPHVAWCNAWFADGECKYMNGCDAGYEPDPLTVYTPAAVCNPKNYNITYNCGVGATGTPLISADTATYDDTYIVKNAGGVNCQKVGFNFVGWLFDGDNYLHQADDRITWTYTSNKTFTAQYSQCAAGEVWVDGECEPCTCSQDNWSSGVASCTASPSSISTCSAVVTCDTGYNNPQGNCNGATCSAQCDQIQSNAIYVCGDGATGYAPATETMSYGDTHTVKGQASCAKSGYTFNGWNFTGTNGNYNPGATVQWNYGTDQTFTGNWCENCVQPDHGECSLNAGVAGMCSYNCNCNAGYTLVGGVCTAHPVCERSEYNITYQPNGGMNNGVLGQPVIQDVTYGVGFTTKDGTIFTMENSIITAWDHVDGGNYPDLNAWYQYNTVGDTVLDAHWEQCTCTADNCTTSATDSNTCACSATCPTGYTYGGCNCNGTVCAPTCTQCAETEISINNECVECECTPGAGAATCGTLSTIGNICEWTPSCLDRFVNVNANCTGIGNTTCNPTCTECPAGWISNANHTECEICPANTYQSGNTCVPCQNGYTSPAGSSSADACVPGAHTIHYLSNNGMNQTYDQSVTYGQSFMTEGGTRFTKTNHIMTHWNVESGPSNTFTNGSATLSGNYTYGDTADTTLSAQWAQCTCDADNCTTYATNSNTCACNATCPTGYTYGGCECDGTVCEPICTLGGSNAIYKCGTGIGTGYSTYVNYGVTHTILTNAFVGCYRDNSTFAGWAFNGDNNIYFDNVGATVTWDYTTDKEFEARWCSNCPVVEHGTNLLTIPEPGLCRCDLTCDTGYHVENGACEPNVYPNENGITYKPNGGTPNQNYTQSVTYDAPFTTLGAVYSKARHILNSWDVESGGAGTFNGTAALNTTYTYHTDGATSLLAKWIECGINEISLDNRCQQCQCTENAGVTSCETSATNNDTCSCTGECAAGYINAGCNCNGTNCTQSCTKCADNQVSVNNACENCVCEKNIDGIEGIISGCVFVSNNGNTCNWNPTTCRLGYGNPDLTCTETEHNNNCTASCTICPAGTYGDNGIECKPCPEGKTSLAGATSIRECFIDPNSCAPDEHIEHGECVSNTRACSIPDATSAVRIWNPAIGTYGPCTVEVDGCNSGYHVSGNVCVKDTEACTVEHGHGERDWNGTSWGACGDVVCDPGYEPNSDYTACVECSNRRVNGDIAVSGYIYECEIAACMYQGQKYALQDGECVPICENASDETGTKVWDERTKKCIRTCNPGYKMW